VPGTAVQHSAAIDVGFQAAGCGHLSFRYTISNGKQILS
jgi:hypothetical protein